MGTIAYSAPERLSEEGLADHPADVYSFGMCVQQLVSGERPFADMTYGEWGGWVGGRQAVRQADRRGLQERRQDRTGSDRVAPMHMACSGSMRAKGWGPAVGGRMSAPCTCCALATQPSSRADARCPPAVLLPLPLLLLHAAAQMVFGVLCRGMKPPWPEGRCEVLRPLYEMCCADDPAQRPTFHQVREWVQQWVRQELLGVGLR